MKLNKKDKNYLLSTLFKGYVIQCAAISVLILGSTFLLGIMAEDSSAGMLCAITCITGQCTFFQQ